MEDGAGKRCPCPCRHEKDAPGTPDLGKVQSVNTVVAFSVVSPEIRQAIESIKYIAENMRSRNKAREVSGRDMASVPFIQLFV